MQSKVILFCAVLFCSQIVDSISRRGSRLENRENSPSNWRNDQNVPDDEYTHFTPARNVITPKNLAINRESTQNDYPNQPLQNYNGYFNLPVESRPASSSSSGPDHIELQEDGGRVHYSPVVEPYPSQVGFENQQFKTKNWLPQSQFTNFASNSVPIPTYNGSPSVNTVQEPYAVPLQYFPPQKLRNYPSNRPYLVREPFQYSVAGNAGDSFVANSGFGSSGQERPYENYITRSDLSSTAHLSNYDNDSPVISKKYNYSPDSGSINDSESYNEGKATASKIKEKLNVGRRPAKRLASKYNESPASIGTDTLEDRSGNVISDTAPIIHYDDEANAATDKYSTVSRPNNGKGTGPYEIIGEDQAAPSDVKPRPKGRQRHAQKYPVHENIVKKAEISKILSVSPLARKNARNMDDSYDGIPTGKKGQSGNYEYASSASSPSNTNPSHNLYHKALDMKDIKINKLVKEPEMQNLLSKSDSRFLIIHPNGTVEYVNDLDSHQNSKLRLVNTKRENVAVTEGDGTQSPDNVQNNIAKTSVPEDKSSLPANNQPAIVSQTNTAKESNSNLPIKDLPADQSNLNTKTPLVNQTGEVNDTNSSSPREIKPAVDKTTLPSNGHQLEDNNTFIPLHPPRRHPTHRNKLKQSHGHQLKNDDDSRPSSPNEKQQSGDNNSQILPSKKNQSTVRRPHRSHHAHKSKSSQGNPPAEGGNDSSPSNPEKNQLSDAKNSKPLPLKENQSEHESNTKPSGESQQGDDNKFKPKPLTVNQSVDDKTSPENKPGDIHNSDSLSADKNQSVDDDTSPENKPWDIHNPDSLSQDKNQSDDENQTEDENRLEDDKTSKPLRTYENQSTGDSKPTLPGGSEIDKQSDSTTFSPTASDDTTSPKPKKRTYRHQKRNSTTSSPIVYSTTQSSEKTSEDQIVTLSPIEQVTDNVSDVQPVTTTTTTAKPIETLGKTDITKYASNKQDDEQEDASSSSEDLASSLDKLQTSTTTESPSSSTTPTDITTDDKTTKETAESKDTQTNDKAITSQGNNGKNDIQTVQSAVYDSSELLDTNTDVPAESDDYSPVTTSPSVHNDVDSGDTSGDNTLELEQPETDVTITVSSSKANDSEDEIITINIEISESTGLSGKNKTLIVSIDTDNEDDDDAKTPKSSGSGSQSSDCNKDHDDGRGKNLEIDMSNIQGEPTIWIRTTNKDLIDKLTDKNDTSFDIVYFFNNVNQPAIERVKETTIHCNGTVVIESKDITYANKDDPTPTITKTTQTIQIEDYKRFGLELS